MPKGSGVKPSRKRAVVTEAEWRSLLAKSEYHLNIADDWSSNHAFQCSGCHETVVCEGEFSPEFCDECTAATVTSIPSTFPSEQPHTILATADMRTA